MTGQLAVALLLGFACVAAVADDRPNFVFILTDDQSYGMMGCDANELTQTPHIDQLARDGVFFDRAYITSAICTPSRISILLSQFERKHGVNFNSGTSVSPEAWAKSYPVIMREHGYYTGYVGKNHAPIGEGGYESGLMDESFDYFYAGHGHIRFYPKEIHEIFRAAKSDTQVEVIQEGVDDFLSNEHRLERAIRFLDSRPGDKPFCLSICFNLPHDAGAGTMESRQSDDEIYKSLYGDVEIPLPENYVAKADITTPKLPPNVLKVSERQTGYDYSDEPQTAIDRIRRRMQAMTGIDRLVGKVRERLSSQGLDQNTILIFTSDHGLFTGEQGLGGKALCYEQTTHVPLIVYNPQAPSAARGRRCDEFAQSIDIAPMMLEYAGIDRPGSFQGKSIRGLVDGDAVAVHDYIFTENLWATHFGNPRIEAVQDKEWKYIRYYANESFPASIKIRTAKELGIPIVKMLYTVNDDGIAVYRHYVESPLAGEQPIYEELYHVGVDPHELNNVINEPSHAEVLARLRGAWWEKLKYARGTGNPKVLRYTEASELERKLKEYQVSARIR
ncbi:sulfatase-like hydrolase/transferase [Aporhodopirellula aestuarii]|uniref:Sulfatase-like hydrolase/transferase n=1 Tax=Aporhodopirellula aestuarii TaxID=2950107 RepID=A0ABT0TX45_9BACT|nr:sulfatase-like hydrolase/transferase [Aporhodopirellula aestuarii]MCM2369165.1 sulfatase-like hydrolase/transferase [Aporhodopirellula aestuarii]